MAHLKDPEVDFVCFMDKRIYWEISIWVKVGQFKGLLSINFKFPKNYISYLSDMKDLQPWNLLAVTGFSFGLVPLICQIWKIWQTCLIWKYQNDIFWNVLGPGDANSESIITIVCTFKGYCPFCTFFHFSSITIQYKPICIIKFHKAQHFARKSRLHC